MADGGRMFRLDGGCIAALEGDLVGMLDDGRTDALESGRRRCLDCGRVVDAPRGASPLRCLLSLSGRSVVPDGGLELEDLPCGCLAGRELPEGRMEVQRPCWSGFSISSNVDVTCQAYKPLTVAPSVDVRARTRL